MQARGYDQCCPRPHDPDIELKPLLDFTSGYIQRAIEDGALEFTRLPSAPRQVPAADMPTQVAD